VLRVVEIRTTGRPPASPTATTARFAVTAANPALRDGAQIDRYAAAGPGIYAFSRIGATEQVEYVVAVNNSTSQQTANVRTYSANTPFLKVYPTGNETVDTSGSKDLAVTVPPLAAVVYKAALPLAKSAAAPPVSLTLLPGGRLTGRAPIGATVASDGFNQVTFAVKVGNSSQWTLLGTDDNPGYKVYFDTTRLEPGTRLLFRAVVTDNAGHTSVSQPVAQTVGARPAPAPSTPVPTGPAPTPTPSGQVVR
jgi:hypothetical protein